LANIQERCKSLYFEELNKKDEFGNFKKMRWWLCFGVDDSRMSGQRPSGIGLGSA
jgi:hypothetical protein